ncbi:MAG: sensor histidine kinase [Deltaproteobacteria bacterium]|jgi:signal transduction histidine kinase|nr:sensor histidine kinase [Deltaproteobacteria bacterium]
MARASILRLATIIILILTITALHYLTDTHHDKAHDVYRRLYYIPIVLGGFWFTLRGGLGTALVATILYVPHVVFQWGNNPSMELEQYLEIVLYNGIGFLTGFLTLRERQQKFRYQRTAENLEKSYHKLRDQADQIIEIEEQLRRADRLSALGELSAGMAHEIRNPLGSIRGTAEILKENVPPDDPKYEFAEILIQEVDRLNHVLEDFLTFAKPASTERTWIDINNIVKNVLDLIRQQAVKNKINVSFWTSDLPKIPGHAEQIKQALLNIILNALQVMNGGGDLAISTSLESDYAHVKITDTGPGVAPKDRDRIFNPFVTTRTEGTGLGLAITQRIIDGHNGRIELTSELGHGTTFTVCLPIK